MNNVKQLDQFPMAQKVTENIYLLSIPVPYGMSQVNCFLFRGENGFTLVDTGSPGQEGKEIWEKLISSGIIIEKIVLTHYHIDHLGLARWFQQKHHIPIYISSLGFREMQKRRNHDYEEFVINLFNKNGLPDGVLRRPEDYSYFYQFEPDELFEDGEHIMLGNDIYEAIWTPGHSVDQFCFYNKRYETMVVGDHILEKISPVILLESHADKNPLKDYFKSLDEVEKYSVKHILPGHGRVIKDLPKRTEKIKSGHHHRMGQILDLVKKEGKTAWQITQETYGSSGAGKFFSPFMATITRCIYLESHGKLESILKDGKIYYHAN